MRRTIAVRPGIAALLLAPLALVAPARADVPSGTLTGTVVLLDGHTPASAAVVDLSTTPGGVAFARGVSGYDGAFAVAIPATPDLVALAAASDDRLDVYATVSKLVATTGLPVFAQVVVHTVAYLEGTDGAVNDSVGGIGGQAYFLVPHPSLGTIGPKVVGLAGAARVYQDPDLIAGQDDVNDPDLIPPLGMEMLTVPVTDASAANISGVNTGLLTPANDGTPPAMTGCATRSSYAVPAHKGDPQPLWGVALDVHLFLLHCTDEEDSDHDYYVIVWGGNATNQDEGSTKTALWRLKYRTDVGKSTPYERVDVDPKQDISTSGSTQIRWTVGTNVSGVNASVSGDYTVVKGKKIHPWADAGSARELSHVSWISDHEDGSRGALFYNGGGVFVRVPQDDTGLIQKSNLQIQVWRCWINPKKDVEQTCEEH
jgi:hypothetical protein